MRLRVLIAALAGVLGCAASLGTPAGVGRAEAAGEARAGTRAVVDWNRTALATAAVSNGVREGHDLALAQAAVFDAVKRR